MWVRLDDQLHSHPKVLEAWDADPATLGLHLLALSHAGCYLTDGFISEAFVKRHLPVVARRRKVTAALVTVELWDAEPGGWRIHDYLEYNPSREVVSRERAWDRKRKELFRDPDLIAAIRARDGDRCRYCGVSVNWKDRRGDHGGTYDHVIPRGDNSLANVVVACRRCNCRKNNRTPAEAGMELIAIQNGSRSELERI